MDSIRQRIRDLALNLWWTWQPDVIELFRDVDPLLWRDTHHNPLAMLQRLSDEDLRQRVRDRALEVDSSHVPRRWVGRMKHAVMTLAWRFSADRMVTDYVRECYLPAAGGVSQQVP